MKQNIKLQFVAEVLPDLSLKHERPDLWRYYASRFVGKKLVINSKLLKKRRTLKQNGAVHLYFEILEEEAQNKGQTMDLLIKNPAEVPITRHMLKDFFRLLGKAMFNKDSTADLTSKEFSEVADAFQRIVAQRLDIDIPFPSIEHLDGRVSNI